MNTPEYSQVMIPGLLSCCYTPLPTPERWESHTLGGQRRGVEGLQPLSAALSRCHLLLDSDLLLMPETSRAWNAFLRGGLPIRNSFEDMTPNTPHAWAHIAHRGAGKYLPSEAPVYPWGAVTSGWTPFNIYPCGFHRSAAQARQTLLIKTGACFKEAHSGHQSALGGQRSQVQVASRKLERDMGFFYSSARPPLFPPTSNPHCQIQVAHLWPH